MNLIFQAWNGPAIMPGNLASRDNLGAYAERINAYHRFDHNHAFMGELAKYYDPVRPLFDPGFDIYDKVASVDLDVFAVDGLTDDLFAAAPGDIAMIEETHQPALRAASPSGINGKNDDKWAKVVAREYGIVVPRDNEGRVRVFNTGVLVTTRAARERARSWPKPRDYVRLMKANKLPDFYGYAQDYVSAMVFLPGRNFAVLPPEWNAMVHHVAGGVLFDGRVACPGGAKLVHVMIRMADWQSAEWHHAVVNLPPDQWLPIQKPQ